MSTARVYLPATPLASPLPVIAIGHPTDGLARRCAPSMDLTSNEDLALPWAGLGYAVIVPDYAGLGNDGVSRATSTTTTPAYSVLDGARALRKLPRAERLLASRCSPPAGARAAARSSRRRRRQELRRGGTLVGVIAFAPEWQTRLNSFGYVDLLEQPDASSPSRRGSATRGRGDAAVRVSSTTRAEPRGRRRSPPPTSPGSTAPSPSLCQTPLGGYLQAAEPHVGRIFRPDVQRRRSSRASTAGRPAARIRRAHLLQLPAAEHPHGRPVRAAGPLRPGSRRLHHAGGERGRVQHRQDAGRRRHTRRSAPTRAAQHTNVVGRNMDFAITWAQALLSGSRCPRARRRHADLHAVGRVSGCPPRRRELRGRRSGLRARRSGSRRRHVGLRSGAPDRGLPTSCPRLEGPKRDVGTKCLGAQTSCPQAGDIVSRGRDSRRRGRGFGPRGTDTLSARRGLEPRPRRIEPRPRRSDRRPRRIDRRPR